MPSESQRWKTGAERNTIGHTGGATGAVTGGVEGHVKAEPRTKPDDRIYGGPTKGLERHQPKSGRVED